MTTTEELQIIEQVRQGDTNAFGSLVVKYQDVVFSMALKILRNREDAEEIAQEAFIKAFRSLHGFRGDSKFSTWLYTITYNTCITHTRKKKNPASRTEEIPDADDEAGVVFGEFPEELRLLQLEAAMKQLPEEEYMLILLYYYDDQDIREICRITGFTESNVKVKLYRARKKLHDLMCKSMKNETIWQS
ncbi:MAG: sigma-70 family RNA polymerase sigma factor [Prolixibacteraceae bacterium]|jgi:RNA polymerase sigma-70 factor (ECF subfamily)|nr:sigma-70 family RNA polymerase sigma factor [Prolixibacteraceae bacterium]MDI9563523.1 sigma-70 family RNA polymerase sigma factor [Bacteroidota bacterium]NLS99015.1 sigma-70 family RNA polymerase sigma factor [Bacteroidales bacterium]OQB80861.1 MAG: ECF RNA polymerase sigma factor SigW [Bacteroidetes bacterium ADurb.Bin123]HNU77085.1 sigma-70 family RNA polymerase sigma factor [Prolixibacteraceae bacterium]